jgi:hypothetical protein
MRLRAGRLLIVLLCAAGCAQQGRPRVQGKVTLHEKPLGNQTLTLFFDGPAGEAFAKRISIAADGTFNGEVPGPGVYKVSVEESMAAQENPEAARSLAPVPAKYRDRSTSGLEWDIKPGNNDRDFALP